MKGSKIFITTLTLALIILSAPLVQAQHPAVQDFYNHYEDDQNVHHIVLDGGLFQLLAWVASWEEGDEEAQALKRITKNLEGINIIVVPKEIEGKYTFAQVKEHVKKDNFSELMNMRDKGSFVSFYAQGKEKEVRDMIIFIDDENEYSIISLKGILNMDDLKYLASHHNEIR